MDLYERVADLPLVVDGVDLDLRERETSSGFARTSTVVTLHGDGDDGRGEDVTYDTEDHEAWSEGFDLPVTGEYTLDSFSRHLDEVALFPGEPTREASRRYRRWGLESAALDLALRQAGTDLGSALDRGYDPVRFVVSTRLGEPPSTDRVDALLDADPDLEFKLDATSEWGVDLVADLAETGRVRIVDLKGQYHGNEVDQPPDPDLYRLVVEGFPDALVEDPGLTEGTRAVLEPVSERVTWDVPITGVESVRDLPWDPEWLNVKPSRFGTVESLFDTLEYCAERGVDVYGGGQFELDVGRGQIQLLASLFSPDAPNDVAPGGYNDPEPRPGLPGSPLAAPTDPVGFRWDDA